MFKKALLFAVALSGLVLGVSQAQAGYGYGGYGYGYSYGYNRSYHAYSYNRPYYGYSYDRPYYGYSYNRPHYDIATNDSHWGCCLFQPGRQPLSSISKTEEALASAVRASSLLSASSRQGRFRLNQCAHHPACRWRSRSKSGGIL